MRIIRSTKNYNLIELSGGYCILKQKDSDKTSPAFQKSTEIWKNLRYPQATNTAEFETVCEYIIGGGGMDWQKIKFEIL